MLDDYLDLLDMAYYEVGFAFQGLSDANVWRRPAQRLLSPGEIAGHIAYWDAVRFAGEGADEPDLAKCRIQSPLIDARFRYYTSTVALDPIQLTMTADEVSKELTRIHQESMAQLRASNPQLDAAPPGWPQGGPSGTTLREFQKYQIFHVSYHTGQIYTARHLLGEVPPDN